MVWVQWGVLLFPMRLPLKPSSLVDIMKRVDHPRLMNYHLNRPVAAGNGLPVSYKALQRLYVVAME